MTTYARVHNTLPRTVRTTHAKVNITIPYDKESIHLSVLYNSIQVGVKYEPPQLLTLSLWKLCRPTAFWWGGNRLRNLCLLPPWNLSLGALPSSLY